MIITEILTRDITQTINFIENDCDDDTFCRIGEVFDDVAEITQSKEFLAAIKRCGNVTLHPICAQFNVSTTVIIKNIALRRAKSPGRISAAKVFSTKRTNLSSRPMPCVFDTSPRPNL